MIVMDWNIEHMNSWWSSGNTPTLLDTFAGNKFSPRIKDVHGLTKRVANVIREVNPDVITIQEGPGVPEARDFFQNHVGGDWKILRGSGTTQALVVAARSDGEVTAIVDGPTQEGDVSLEEQFNADADGDLQTEALSFARVPQVVELTVNGRSIRIINNHLKSKHVNGGQEKWEAGGNERQGFIAEALKARRRISAEAYHIRSYLDALFNRDPTALVILTGDLNDGPGTDFFEENYLTHSVVDRIFGSIFYPQRQLTHILLHGNSKDHTAEFYDFVTKTQRKLLLDHIGISPELSKCKWKGRVAVKEFDQHVVSPHVADNQDLWERERVPSDHRPIVLDIEL